MTTTTTVTADGGGLRNNQGKPLFSLVPPEASLALADHYRLGVEVSGYPHRNWERGMAWCKCYDSLQRHAHAWLAGEDFDIGAKGNGAHHMIAVAWNAFAIFTYHKRGIGTDDRGVTPVAPKESGVVVPQSVYDGMVKILQGLGESSIPGVAWVKDAKDLLDQLQERIR